MPLFSIPSLGAILAVIAWLLMLGFGVMHSAGLVGTTIGYDEAMGISLCFFPLVLLVVLIQAVTTARAIGIAATMGEDD